MPEPKALVVDDEIHIVQVVAIKLKNNGFNVFTAENGSEAMKIALQETPDIVITDFQMPGMTGIELIQRLRDEEQTQHVPVIMLTARGFSIEDEQMQKLQISSCLSKPFSPREVLSAIEEILAQHAN